MDRRRYSYSECVTFFQSKRAIELDQRRQKTGVTGKDLEHYGEDLLIHVLPEERNRQFKIFRLLLVGGESVVLYCYDKIFERPFVAKIAHTDYNKAGKRSVYTFGPGLKKSLVCNDNVMQQRFIRGARLQTKLHRKVNTVYGKVPECYTLGLKKLWLEMEYLPGPDLLQFINLPGKSFPHAFDIFYRLVVFMREVHRNNVLHRDLKPENIKVYGQDQYGFGRVGVCDWTVAKEKRDKTKPPNDLSALSFGDFKIHSHGYSSPVMQHRANEAEIEDDIFSLGRIFWTVLTRRIPKFPQFDREWDVKTLEDTVCGSGKIYKRAISQDPREQYHSCEEILEDLIEFAGEVNLDVADIETPVIYETEDENGNFLYFEDEETPTGQKKEERKQIETEAGQVLFKEPETLDFSGIQHERTKEFMIALTDYVLFLKNNEVTTK